MASSRKRPRASDSENRQERVQERKGGGEDNKDKDKDNRAECPFHVHIVDPSVEEKKQQQKNKKRRRTTSASGSVDATDADEDNTSPADKIHFQQSPFHPSGKFRTYSNLDVHYKVEPAKEWLEMTRYNSFVCESLPSFSS